MLAVLSHYWSYSCGIGKNAQKVTLGYICGLTYTKVSFGLDIMICACPLYGALENNHVIVHMFDNLESKVDAGGFGEGFHKFKLPF